MSWCLFHVIDGKVMETFAEIVLNNMSTQRALDFLWAGYGTHRNGFKFYGDASGRSGSTNSDFSDYVIIANDERFKSKECGGRTLHYPPANPSRHDRFSAANAKLCNAKKEVSAFIDPKCVKLIQDLQMRAYAPGTMELPANEGLLGHISDAWSYPIYREWPVRFNVSSGARRVYTSSGEVAPYQPLAPWPNTPSNL